MYILPGGFGPQLLRARLLLPLGWQGARYRGTNIRGKRGGRFRPDFDDRASTKEVHVQLVAGLFFGELASVCVRISSMVV